MPWPRRDRSRTGPAAAEVYRVLGGFRARDGYLCRCPVEGHGQGRGDRHPSLSVRDGARGLRYHCFAGCAPADIRASLEGLDLATLPAEPPLARAAAPKTTTADALELWHRAVALEGTHGAAYLETRRLPASLPTLRFLPDYRLRWRRYPCLVAALQAPDRQIVSVQLTLLDARHPAKAPIAEPRRIIGPSHGFALRLAPPAETLGLAEGYETGHAAMLRYRVPVWCSLGAARLPFVGLPDITRRVIVFADPDAPGLKAAERVQEDHPEREVIVHPPKGEEDFAALWERDPQAMPALSLPLLV